MRFLFVIQGEGRGHMTQAMAMYQLLIVRGHDVCDVVIGTSNRREIPGFIHQQIHCPIHRIHSPNFVTDSKQKSIKLWATFSQNLQQTSTFYNSLFKLKALVDERQPDVIVNFYDLLAGLYNGLFRPEAHFMTIGHQYLIAHPDFPFATGAPLSKLLFKLATKLTAWGAKDQIALSFRPYAEDKTQASFRIWPPLLRTKIKSMLPTNGDFFLTYLVNPGYADDVKAWAKSNPETKIEAFWDQKGQTEPYRPLPNLCFYPLNESLFLEKMAACKALACTAGFESVCEAMYFGKPVMLVPVAGQYEQACNAVDAVISGAGMASDFFDFTEFKTFLIENHKKSAFESTFHDWMQKQETLFDSWLDSLENQIDKENQSQLTALSITPITSTCH
ncbi:glycosyltransferase family protein [Lunatibacter salilacus]|uniref:glycosyltransferase family protein n=1 Tax=Lunatibacter salilacus TaxID=2483804 RepID=UPI00131CFDC3|nr:glycosyltransferase family protein [Lunatibacter salilacus]